MSVMYRVQLPLVWTRDMWTNTEIWPIVSPSFDELELKKQWCKDVVGANGWNYYGVHKKVMCEFRFKREEDLLAFKLRFGV